MQTTKVALTTIDGEVQFDLDWVFDPEKQVRGFQLFSNGKAETYYPDHVILAIEVKPNGN